MRRGRIVTNGPSRGAHASSQRGERSDVFLLCVSAILLVYVWRVQDILPFVGALKLSALGLVAAAGIAFLDRHPLRSLVRLKIPVVYWLGFFVFVALLTLPFGLYPGRSFYFLTETFSKTVAAGLLLALSVRSVRDLERYMAVWVAGGILYSLLLLARSPTEPIHALRYYDQNDFSVLLACSVPMTVYFARHAGAIWRRVGSLIAGALFVGMIVLMGSRSGFVAVATMGGYLLVATDLPARVKTGAVALIVGTLLVVGGPQYWDRMGTMLEPTEDYNWAGQSPAGRLEIWQRGIGYLADRPLRGVGARNFSVAEGTLSELSEERREAGRGWKWSAAHNSYLEIAVELGVFGIISFLAILYGAFRISRRARSWRPDQPRCAALGDTLGASLLAFSAGAFFLSLNYSESLWLLLGLLVGLGKLMHAASRRSSPFGPTTGPSASRDRASPAAAPMRSAGRRFARRPWSPGSE